MPRKVTNEPTEPTTRERLEFLRDTLLESIATARQAGEDKQGQVAPLAKQYRDTLAAIDALPEPKAKSTVDELKKRRAARASAAPVRARAPRKVVGGEGGSGAGGKRRPASRPVAETRARRGSGRTG